MPRRRLTVLAATLGLSALALTACSGGATSEASSGAGSEYGLVSDGTLTVATEGTYRPFSYHEGAGELTGFDVEIAKAVEEIKGGKIEFRVDKHANVHFVVGKASFSAEQLDENLKAALEEIVRLKPSSSKGRYIQKGAVSTTFGPGIPLDVNSIM